MKKIITAASLCLLLASCAPYKLVKTESISVKGMEVTPLTQWNKSSFAPGKKVEIWTADGHSLNEMIFIGEVNQGETLFKKPSDAVPMPTFKSDMLPNELEDLIASSLKNLMGGKLDISTSGLRPHQIGDNMGFRFNIDYFTEDGLAKRGDVLTTIKDGQLYAMVLLATKIHYFDKYAGEFDVMVNGMKI